MSETGAETVTGAEAAHGPGRAVPAQQRRLHPARPAPGAERATRPLDRQASAPFEGPGGPSPAEAVRGEHVHGEQPTGPRRQSVRAQVLDALRAALLNGELSPGRVYSAPALAARFGVSPTPVREAMQQLAGEGVVETVPNRGFRVAERTARDVAELAEVRVMVQVPALHQAVRLRAPGSWRALRPLADEVLRCAVNGDVTGYAAADRAFHSALVEPCGNRRLTRLVEELCRGAQPGLLDRATACGVAARYGALLDALTAPDLPTAERLLREILAV
ncbi:GntR family transcriptional regulator [Streptomyces alkaliterrae]|uniref:GntR family transcriptional regulator n=1 Tax=Streptomyces alkaliterrae TaxID=2213162 RepID=A0A5P0YRJ4_9ACTN|nr:GntR family transcriptional regulator [Streptomyces alkaliterrae]MBB1258755.1 GntR family transcriptional regulator [Streptomyces alkaliterrae]MQS02895.1 GntR family transcriptional regulator [Streptomyces alkaliterrae]